MSTRTGEDRLLTVPNVVSVVRLCLIPVFVWLLFGRESRAGAAVLLGALGATDWVDGFVARRYDQVTTFGKMLDPVADRLLLGTAVICVLIDGSVPLIVAIPLMVREALVAGTVLVLASMGAKRIDVTFWGKAGTFANMCAFPLFLVGNDNDVPLHDIAYVLAWIAAVLGFAFSWYSAAKYIPLAKRALADGRSVKDGPPPG